MELHVFSDDKRLNRLFSNIPRARFHPLKELAALVPTVRTSAFFYIDLAGLTKSRLTAFRRAVDAHTVISYGFIDATGTEPDPALLLLAGARDYLGPALCAKPLAAARVRLVTTASGSGAVAGPKKAEAEEEKETLSTAPRARDWTSITPGEEYVFRMLYIELDGHKDMSVRVADNALGRLLDYFQKGVAEFIRPGAGKLWIWNDFSGIALFPFKEKADEVAAVCLRLMLSRRLLSVDQNIQKLLFSYRLVLMTGGTIYRERGKTGRIISDAVNSLSHIGMKFAKPGNCYLSRDIYEDLSPNLQKCFTPAGTFEHVPLLRFKLPAKY